MRFDFIHLQIKKVAYLYFNLSIYDDQIKIVIIAAIKYYS